MSQYWSDIVHTLTPYVPGEQPKITNLIKLNTNECPYGPSPKAIEAIKAASNDDLRLYPDPNGDALKDALAKRFQLERNQVFVGNGSDEILAHTFIGLLKRDKPLLFPDITYSFYPVYCRLYDVNFNQVPLNDHFEIDIESYQQPCGGVIIPNPNAPTGALLPLDKIEQLAQQHADVPVVIDEAYIDFGGASAASLINRFPNLLVIQTFSKSRSLAGLRVGFALGNADLIAGLERVKNSFNSYPLDRLALAGSVASVEDEEYFDDCCRRVIATRTQLVAALDNLGFSTLPSSAANFVFTQHPDNNAASLAEQLRARNIIVRHFKQGRIDNFLRISIGSEAEITALIEALTNILKK
ncbi:histidinol-phosphate transaminase [Aurantivibrio plasticivorans]